MTNAGWKGQIVNPIIRRPRSRVRRPWFLEAAYRAAPVTPAAEACDILSSGDLGVLAMNCLTH